MPAMNYFLSIPSTDTCPKKLTPANILELPSVKTYDGMITSTPLLPRLMAHCMLGFLRRNMRGCKSSARAAAYQGLERPTLEYACSTWDQWNSGNIQQVEKVQRRAARFVTRNYHDRHPGSVTQMVQQLQLEPLQFQSD